MAEPIKLSQEELEELRAIQTAYQEKTFSFGQLYIDKLNLVEKQKDIDMVEDKIKQELIDTQKKEQAWMDKVSTKYGDGNLSLSTGTFIPKEK
jgi:hypothetical protein